MSALLAGYGYIGYSPCASLGTESLWGCQVYGVSGYSQCEFETVVATSASGPALVPAEPWPYWEGQVGSSPPYKGDVTCTVASLDNKTGRFEVDSEWSNAPSVLGGFYGTVSQTIAAQNATGVPVTIDDETEDDGPVTLGGAPDYWYDIQSTWRGNLDNPDDVASGGTYEFIVSVYVQAPTDAEPVEVGSQACTISSPGVYSPTGTVCPDGTGTCAAPSLCDSGLSTWVVDFGLASWTIPIPMPGSWDYLACLAEQVGEWAFFPQEGVLDDWQNFGTVTEARPPASWFYDGTAYVFKFTSELSSALPLGQDYYVDADGAEVPFATACAGLIPSVLPTGGTQPDEAASGGSISASGLCGNGTSDNNSISLLDLEHADDTGQTLIEIAILLMVGFGLISLAWSLLKPGA
jgi:hypothetical protein